jgi:hypothetical protein
MIWSRATTALLGIWIFTGAGVEALHWHERRLAIEALHQHERRLAVAHANFAKAERFVDDCLRGGLARIDDLVYDCGSVRRPRLPARLVQDGE